MMTPQIYLDYAATSAVRPEAVIDAVARYLRDIGATPGRSGHRRALDAGRIALRCRRRLAELLGIPGDPGRIAFQLNATHALNVALFGSLGPGDRVVRTAYDHNAVRRPIAALRARGIRETVIPGRRDGSLDLDELEHALAGAGTPARMLVLPHATNVFGTLLPVWEAAARAHAYGALLLVDAAQSAGHVALDVGELGIDLLAVTGHKGLLGPQGVGALWVREGLEIPPSVFGGTGGDSWPDGMPSTYPDRLEAGTQNGPGIAGLLAGIEWLLESGVDEQHARIRRLKHRLRSQIEGAPGVTLHSPPAPDGVGIVTVTVDGLASAELAHRLDAEFGVLARAGLHCAAESHRVLGTERDGALRLSLGWASTEADVDRAADALRTLAGNAAGPAAVLPLDGRADNAERSDSDEG